MAGWLRFNFGAPDIGKHLLRGLDEVVIDEVRRHWFAYSRPIGEALLGAALLITFPFWSVQAAWVPLLIAPGLLGHAAWIARNEYMDRFVVTNLRVFRVRGWGVLPKSFAAVPLRRILDMTVEEPLTGRLMGFGHFVFESAAQEQGLREIRYVGHANERQKTIQSLVMQPDSHGPTVD